MNININLTEANLPDVDLAKTICRLFADELAIEIPETDTDLVQCGLLDSLTLVDLLVHLERSFGFTVVMDELDLEDFRSVDRIAAYVDRCRA
jgi:acyl carrier protein